MTWTCGDRGCSEDVTFSLTNLNPVLRPAALSSSCSAVLSATATTAAGNQSTQRTTTNGTTYTSGQMAGVGIGIAVPLLIALATTVWMLRAERKKRKALVAHELQWSAHTAQYGHGSADPKRENRNVELGSDGQRHELHSELAELENIPPQRTHSSARGQNP